MKAVFGEKDISYARAHSRLQYSESLFDIIFYAGLF